MINWLKENWAALVGLFITFFGWLSFYLEKWVKYIKSSKSDNSSDNSLSKLENITKLISFLKELRNNFENVKEKVVDDKKKEQTA